MPQVSHTSAQVMAIAEKLGDTALSAFQRDDGTLVIVFCNKGKREFKPEEVEEVQTCFEPVNTIGMSSNWKDPIHTKEEAEEAVRTLPHKSKRKEK